MWFEFACAVLVGAVVLYLPGYCVSRTFGFERFVSLVIAPMFSGLALVLLGVVLGTFEIACAPVVLFLTVLALCVVVCACVVIVRRYKGESRPPVVGSDLFGSRKQLLGTVGLYISVSFVVAAGVFLTAVADPNAFGRFDDSAVHLSVIRGFIETGTYSTLNVSPYMAQGVAGGFYPAEWHIPVAIVASVFANNVSMATTAITFDFLVIVFPLAVLFLMSVLFPDNMLIKRSGSLFVLASSGFPWGFVVFGQLLPNLMSFSFIPMVVGLVMLAANAGERRRVIILATAAFVGFVALSAAHPNGAFACGIWVALYAINRLFYPPQNDKATFSPKRLLCTILVVVVACGMWVLAYRAPFMQSVVQANWAAFLSLRNALLHGLLFKFGPREGIHVFLTVLVFLGIVRTIMNRRYLWLSVAYLCAFALFVIDAATDGPIKHLLTGFWYTDYYRTGAMTALFAIPLITMGFAWLAQVLQRGLEKLAFRGKSGSNTQTKLKRVATVASVALLVAVFAGTQFISVGHTNERGEDKTVNSGWPNTNEVLKSYYSWDRVLTGDELAFVKKALQDIPEGSLIINYPRDGSGWLYGIAGANTYFRRAHNDGMAGEKASELIRLHLSDIESNEEVRDLIRELDARYVLVLDTMDSDHPTYTELRYKIENWPGIESINGTTPGFTLVASEDDMRLYRIDATA